MKKSVENIKTALGMNANVAITSDKLRFSELLEIVNKARSCEQRLTLKVCDNLNANEVRQLLHIGGGFIDLIIMD
jgi:hypothetical protein